MIQKLKKNKKGFSLIELIVVVAILGVLMAVLVPQYIQYVEKSREGVDKSLIGEYFHAVEISAAGSEDAPTDGSTITVTKADGVFTIADGAAGTMKKITDEVKAVITSDAGAGKMTMKSTSGKALEANVFTITFTAGKPAWSSDPFAETLWKY